MKCSKIEYVYGADFNYKITGNVENVAYTDNTKWLCYIAMSTDTIDGKQKNAYHASNRLSMCEFAERCKIHNIQVNLLAADLGEPTNYVKLIEYAGTNSIWNE